MPAYRSGDTSPRPDYVEAGEYAVEIINAEESISQKGNEMIELKLRVEPSEAIVYDNLVFVEAAYWKIDAFRAAIGESVVPGEEVDIKAEDFIGKTGRVRLFVDEYGGRKRNKVAAWLVGGARPQPVAKGGVDDDDIPF
jgi:hypothetical protein